MFFRAHSYLNHFLTARSRYSVHSPYVYDLIENAFRDKKRVSELERLYHLKRDLKGDRRELQKCDFGAGSLKAAKYPVKVSSLARTSSADRESIRLLYKISRHLNPNTVIELGTSLGISTMALAMGAPSATVYTIEGSAEVAGVATENFLRLNMGNIELFNGIFSEQLPAVLRRSGKCDLAYVDGHHQLEPTLEYYEILAGHRADQAVFLFDDIFWSKEMQAAWQKICNDNKPKVTIDIYHKGIVIFNDGLTPQHFKLRY